MNPLATVRRAWQAVRNAYADLSEERYFSDFVGTATAAGIRVDENSAMRCSAVFACARVISESIASLPWHVLAKSGDRREVQESHPAAWLLHVQANPETTAFSFREAMLQCALVFGDGYAEIERDRAGRPIWLWQIHPMRVQEVRDGGRLVYRVRKLDGVDTVDVPAEDMFHIHGPGRDGLCGYNLINLASQSIGLALAMESFGASFFGNGAAPSGVFEASEGLNDKQIAEFKEQLKNVHQGLRNARKPLLTPKGVTWKTTSIAPDEGQFTESRQQQIEEIARWFRVPPHKIGHLLRSTNNNIEHQAIEFVTDCLVPWIVRLEQEANIKLFGRRAQGVLYSKINVTGLLRGDAGTQAKAFALGRQWGWYSANDVRRLRDENPIGVEGDIYLSPMNMVPADVAREVALSKSSSTPANDPPAPIEPDDDELDQSVTNGNLRLIAHQAKEG